MSTLQEGVHALFKSSKRMRSFPHDLIFKTNLGICREDILVLIQKPTDQQQFILPGFRETFRNPIARHLVHETRPMGQFVGWVVVERSA